MLQSILQFLLADGVSEQKLQNLLLFALHHDSKQAQELCMSSADLVEQNIVSRGQADKIVASKEQAQEIAAKLEQEGIRLLWIGDPFYPKRLIASLKLAAPQVLFVKGDFALLQQASVGITGVENASKKGLAITELCVQNLLQDNFCLISGLREGIERTVQKTVQDLHGVSLCVLAEGFFSCQERLEYEMIASYEQSLLISPVAPWQPWSKRTAMMASGLTMALADAMLIIEATKELTCLSFALGKACLASHSPLFVIDFACPAPSALGNAELLRLGACAVRSRGGFPSMEEVKRQACAAQQAREESETQTLAP